uniref:Uncharacterized protein n=1 Tax=Romanomermis culicivorax TaxID=13658 RepID=A0A915HKN3_ROMCU
MPEEIEPKMDKIILITMCGRPCLISNEISTTYEDNRTEDLGAMALAQEKTTIPTVLKDTIIK